MQNIVSGAQIELASGEIKCVEDLTVEDFQRSTELSPDLKLDFSTVDHIVLKAGNTMTLVHFVVGNERLEVKQFIFIVLKVSLCLANSLHQKMWWYFVAFYITIKLEFDHCVFVNMQRGCWKRSFF